MIKARPWARRRAGHDAQLAHVGAHLARRKKGTFCFSALMHRRITRADEFDLPEWAGDRLYLRQRPGSGGNIVNQVQRDFNGLGQLTKEYQSHSGAVNTGTSPKVQYAYSEMSGGANHSRPTSLTYPNGRVIDYIYASGLDSSISRLTSLLDNSVTLESFDYLGLGTVVKRAHPQPGVDLTYIKQSGESTGDAGDQYTGLDRFGRVVDQRWIKISDGSHTDRFLSVENPAGAV